ncbi:hypothetical protein PV325_009407 [Microctonus aethiopoides]|nr:hypothetical protein PV325_009407 [Microctonus aethiopoides]KAK0093203.1 hypothetical protein PV326_014092 [Microctonus aethiopoides]
MREKVEYKKPAAQRYFIEKCFPHGTPELRAWKASENVERMSGLEEVTAVCWDQICNSIRATPLNETMNSTQQKFPIHETENSLDNVHNIPDIFVTDIGNLAN